MCKDTILISDYITIVEPAASFKENYNCEHPLKVEFVLYLLVQIVFLGFW